MDFCAVSESERDKFQIFEQWLLENGAKMPKLELRVSFHTHRPLLPS
jgi:hypothetical protein